MRNRKETAQEDGNRGLGATLRALKQVRELQPPCSRCRRDTAKHVINMTGPDAATALCPSCFKNHSLDCATQRNREERARMRGGR